MRIFYLLFLLGLPGAFLLSQDFSNYTPIRCEGKLPEDFRLHTYDKFKQDVEKEKVETSKHQKVGKTKEEFLLKTNFILNELLSSGSVIFNDRISNYVNQVADTILKNEPELRKKIRFYCLRSSEANAFSTNQGIIFVTLGLIARCKNEAQLAFSLCHEIAHYEKKHVLNSYLEDQKIFSEKGENKYASFEERLRLISTHSRELEFEADSLAFIRYSKTRYRASEMITAFEILQYSYLPFEEVAFKPDFLTTRFMQFSSDQLLDSLKKINPQSDDYDDSKSTHPNIKKRRQKIQGMMDLQKVQGENFFTLSSELFSEVRDYSRFETVRLDLLERKYFDVVYNVFELSRKYPSNKYLERALAKAIYGILKYKNAGEFEKIGADYKNIEGNLQQCYYFFQYMSKEQLNSICCRFLYNIKNKYSDPFLSKITDDAFCSLVQDCNLHYADFAKMPDTTSKTPEEEFKYRGTTHLVCFCDIYSDTLLKKQFDIAEKMAYEKNKIKQQRANWSQRKYNRKFVPLGIDSIVTIDPFFFTADERNGLKIIASERQKIEFDQQIQACAKTAGLNLNLISSKTLTENDVESYNTMAAMNEWIRERLRREKVDMVPLECDFSSEFVKKYGTRYFFFTGLLTYKEIRRNKAQIIVLGVLVPYLFPYAIYQLCTPKHRTYYYSLLFDVENGDTQLARNIILKSKFSTGYISSIMYDQMVQIKTPRKRK